jgi:hypothetical protein
MGMKKPDEGAQSIQRIKVGMTGLAVVMLLIGLASAIFSSASRDVPVAVAGSARPDLVANISTGNEAAVADREPLAELGIAPSATGNSTATDAPTR